jgi:hypothetical protein
VFFDPRNFIQGSFSSSEFRPTTRFKRKINFDQPPPFIPSAMSIIAPAYTNDRFSSSRSALIDEPVIEHEHHHIHHHIDHGVVDNKALTLSSRRDVKDYSYDRDETYDKERRVSGSISVAQSRNQHPREHRYHNHRHRHRSGNNSRVDLSMSNTNSRRSSVVEVSGTTDWAVVDVPPGTRRITIETTGSANNRREEDSREDINISNYSEAVVLGDLVD